MSASAVQRCSRHSCKPLRALPRWRTRRSTVSSRSCGRIRQRASVCHRNLLSQQPYVEPGEHGQRRQSRRARRSRCDRRADARSRSRHPKRGAGCRCTGDRRTRPTSRTKAVTPIGEAIKACVAANTSPPAATATSHQASRIEPTASAMPVSRCRIDNTDVIWKRYQVGNMKGDSGRSMAIPPLV